MSDLPAAVTRLRNPYVGPRTFSRDDAPLFFGREKEARELLDRVMANRLVLFYAQSAAGKSSLIQAALIPDLEQQGFEVLPVGRVSGREWPDKADTNPFVYNLIRSLIPGADFEDQHVELTLSSFLLGLVTEDGRYGYLPGVASGDDRDQLPDQPELDDYDVLSDEIPPRVLIIDQFEEILTTNLPSWDLRTEFFMQLAEAMMDDSFLWIVLAMREDFVAGLDPYAYILSGDLQIRYYMERLGPGAALKAITQPADLLERPFTPEAAKTLLENLRLTKSAIIKAEYEGPYVEPVQLQVVCYRLWQKVSEGDFDEITLTDVRKHGRVDKALEAYYDQAVESVALQFDPSGSGNVERTVRRWVGNKLITKDDTRALVFKGPKTTDTLPNEMVHLLRDAYLLREIPRSGGTWIELIHDRFVEPIKRSNLRAQVTGDDTDFFIPAPATDFRREQQNEALYNIWAENLDAGYKTSSDQFQRTLNAFVSVFHLNVILNVVLFVIGLLSFILALLLAIIQGSLIGALVFGGLSVVLFLVILLSRSTEKLEEDLSNLTQLGVLYNAYWMRVNTRYGRAGRGDQIEDAAEDAIEQLKQLQDTRSLASLRRMQDWLAESDFEQGDGE